jgi:hypothetical protein
MPKTTRPIDHSRDGRDPAVHLTMINTLRRKRDVPVDLFYSYWRDAHVQISSRLPGTHSLWTHWVEFDEGALWPRVPGVSWNAPEHLRFDGVPEPTVLTADGLADLVANLGPLMADEPNIFEETISYWSLGDSSRTLVDRLEDPQPAGEQGVLRLMVFLRRAETLGPDAFRAWVRDDFAPALSADPRVLKLRRHLLEPYDDHDVVLDAGTATVSHAKAPNDQYHAVLEVVFSDSAALMAFATGAAWNSTVPGQQIALAAAHAYHATRTYCARYNGELTTVGLRTAAVAEQIAALGATNQLEDDVRHLVLTGTPLTRAHLT